MFELKRLSKDAIPAALDKALRYRLLNEPAEAESICRDVLSIDPDNEQALVTLLLALTDRFDEGYAVGATQAQEVLSRLRDEYERAYYAGIICERQAKARLHQGHPGAGHDAYEFLSEAMSWFEKAETLRPPKNDDALLHWNTCARIIMGNGLTPRLEEKVDSLFEQAHLVNHLAASGFVLPHHITLDMPGRPHPGDQSITQSEPPECEISGLKIIKYNRCFSLWTSEEIERCVIASFRIEESVGFKGEFRQWEHLLRVGD